MVRARAIAPAPYRRILSFYEQEVVKAFCELTHESSARSLRGRLSWGSAVARVKGRRSLSAAALDAAKGQYAGVWCEREPSRPHHTGAFCAAVPADFHRRPQCCNPGLCPWSSEAESPRA